MSWAESPTTPARWSAKPRLDRAAAVALQPRSDRIVQVYSFNLADEHQPAKYQMPLDMLATQSIDALREKFNSTGGRWAGYLLGSLAILREHG